jgi:HEPN domain-containing protein
MSAATLVVAIQTFHNSLLEEAKKYAKAGQYEAAVVFAQAACEMCTEFALTILLRIRGIAFLTEP